MQPFQMLLKVANWNSIRTSNGRGQRTLRCNFVSARIAITGLEYPTMPPAGSLKVLRAPARRGGIRRAPKTKIYNLETGEYVSNPPFLKTNLAGVISQHTFGREQLELI